MIRGSVRVDEAITQLRAAGERVTPARRALLEVLHESRGHLDAEALAEQVCAQVPGVHRATIYRSLQTLVDAGLVSHTHVPGGATIYHLALHRHAAGGSDDSGRQGCGQRGELHAHGHSHLQCTSCGRFVDVASTEFAPLAARVQELTGFVIDAEHAALLGTCRDCLSESH